MPSKCAGVLLRSGGVLLVRRGAGPWGFPRARVDPTETAAQALVRTFRAEFGVDVEIGSELSEGAVLLPRFSGDPAPAARATDRA